MILATGLQESYHNFALPGIRFWMIPGCFMNCTHHSLAVIAAAAITLAGCTGRTSHSSESESGHNEASCAEEAHHHHDTGVIEFSPAQAEAAGLQVDTLKPGLFGGVILTSGEILPAQGDEKTVAATSSGIITIASPDIVQGAGVRKGRTLAFISAKEMAEGDPAVKTRAAYLAAKKEYDRAAGLVATGAISGKEFEQATLAYETAKAEYEAYRSGVSESGLAVSSPIDGHIRSLLVSDGEYVSAGQAIATISQGSRLILRADVPEKYYHRLSGIRSANFKPSYSDKAYSLRDLGGRLISIGKAAAEGSFYVPVTFDFNNTGDFIPGSFSDIYLLEAERDGVISVPMTALTEEQGVYFVYLKLSEDDYKKQEVKLGESDGIRCEILSGLHPGDVVVTEGAYQVKLASVSGAVPEGHTHNH